MIDDIDRWFSRRDAPTPEAEYERLMSGAAWAGFCDKLKQAGEQVLRPEAPSSARDRAEGFRYLARLAAGAIQQVVDFSDTDRPVFLATPSDVCKWGSENADNLYYRASIQGDGIYKIHGKRNSVHSFTVQTSTCGPMEAPGTGARAYQRSRVFETIDSFQLHVEDDGSFEIILSAEEPADCANWLKLHPEAGWVLIRQYFYAWESESPATFRIDRVDRASDERELTPVLMGEMLDDAGTWVSHAIQYWLEWVLDYQRDHGRNSLSAPYTVEGGAQDILYGQGTYELDADEALIIETSPPNAKYWSFSLVSPWFHSLEFERATSLNGAQAHLDEDGKVRIVIAHSDPGVFNWLDTTGHTRGCINYRWIWSEDAPAPKCKRVPFAEVLSNLPGATPRVTPAEREAQLRGRRAHVLRRFGRGGVQ